jgi:hypothetical protein
MKIILKIIVLVLFIINKSYATDIEIPVFFHDNPFSDESIDTELRGVRILSVDDENFPNYLRESHKKVISEIKIKGFLNVSISKNNNIKSTIKNKKLERSINTRSKQDFTQRKEVLISKLQLDMVDLMKTPLKGATLISIKASGAMQEAGWTGVSRLLEDGYFGGVILEEDEFGLYDGGIILISELINVTINGEPGILIEERSFNNEPYTTLQWASSNKSFILKVTQSASKGNKLKRLIELAESLY